MSEQPDLSTLPQRMRYAAGVLKETLERGGIDADDGRKWSVTGSIQGLRSRADEWEQEDRDSAERTRHIEELAEAMFVANHPRANVDCNPRIMHGYRTAAEMLIESGWRKGDSDE